LIKDFKISLNKTFLHQWVRPYDLSKMLSCELSFDYKSDSWAS